MADPDRTIPSDSSGATSDDGQTSESGTTFLTGTPVFDRWLVGVIQNHLQRAPEATPARLGRRLPAKLERVVLECLEKDPSRRPESAGELSDRLAACDDVSPWPTEEARKWWRRESRVRRASWCWWRRSFQVTCLTAECSAIGELR